MVRSRPISDGSETARARYRSSTPRPPRPTRPARLSHELESRNGETTTGRTAVRSALDDHYDGVITAFSGSLHMEQEEPGGLPARLPVHRREGPPRSSPAPGSVS